MTKSANDARWWRPEYADRKLRGAKLFSVVQSLWMQSGPWRAQAKLNARFYGEDISHAISPRIGRRHNAGQKASRLTLNALRNAADTYVAMLTSDTPKITCMTTGADWDQREKAELTEQCLDGVFAETSFEMTELACVRDSVIFEPGWCYFYEDDADPENPRPAAERLFPWEVLVGDEDALYGKPQSIYLVRHKDRASLMAEFPKYADEIEHSGTKGLVDEGASSQGHEVGVDLVPLIWAWHLPRVKPKRSDDEPKDEGRTDPEPEGEEPALDDAAPQPSEVEVTPSCDGRYVLSVGSIVVEDHEYTELSFPIEALWRQKPLSGIRGSSMVEDMSPIQKDRNVVSQRLQQSIHLVGKPSILVDRASKVNTNKIDNQNSSIIEGNFSGALKPETYTPNVASPQMFEREDKLGDQIFAVTGVSPQLAQGMRPAGLNGAEAQRVHADIASARFRPQNAERLDFRLRAAKQFVRLLNRIAERNPRFWVKPANDEIAEAVVWAEAKMDESEYSLAFVPTNELANSPEGRDDLIQDLINGGTIPQRDGMRLIAQGRADLMGYLKEQPWYASYQYTMKAITSILRGKKPLPAVDFIDLPAALSAAQTAWLDAMVGGCPPDRLAKLTTWMTQVKDLMSRNAPPPPVTPTGAPGAPAAPKPGGQLGVAAALAPPTAPPGAPPNAA